jgi:hypothetical protein
MGIRRIRPADDVPRKSHPPYKMLKEGADGVRATRDIYNYLKVRVSPDGKAPRDLDYQSRKQVPQSQAPQPGFDEYRATYREARNSRVTPAPDEQSPQFPAEKVADHVDVGRVWTRGMGSESPHPAFDSGPSGHRYSTKVRR